MPISERAFTHYIDHQLVKSSLVRHVDSYSLRLEYGRHHVSQKIDLNLGTFNLKDFNTCLHVRNLVKELFNDLIDKIKGDPHGSNV